MPDRKPGRAERKNRKHKAESIRSRKRKSRRAEKKKDCSVRKKEYYAGS